MHLIFVIYRQQVKFFNAKFSKLQYDFGVLGILTGCCCWYAISVPSLLDNLNYTVGKDSGESPVVYF